MSKLIGLITNNPMVLAYIAAACFAAGVVAGGVPAWKYQGALKDAVQANYDKFVAGTAAAGIQAEKDKAAKEAQDKRDKENYDEQEKKDAARIAILNKQLLDARAGGGYLPPASPSSSRPDRVCFNRPLLDGAIRQTDAGVSSLIKEGDGFRLKLDIGRLWAQSRRVASIPRTDRCRICAPPAREGSRLALRASTQLPIPR